MASASDWMPSTWAGKRAMYENIEGKIAGHAAELDLTPAEVTEIEKMCAAAIAVIDFNTEFASTAHAVTEWRDNVFNGIKGKTLTDPPTPETFTNDPAYETGIFQATRDWRDRWLAANGYTKAIGEDLMILGTKGDKVSEADVTPTISAHAAASGYLVGLIVTGREDSDQWIVETRQNGGSWTNTGSFTGKTADVHITPTTPGQPEVIEIRVRLRRKNADYGNPSQIATVTVNP